MLRYHTIGKSGLPDIDDFFEAIVVNHLEKKSSALINDMWQAEEYLTPSDMTVLLKNSNIRHVFSDPMPAASGFLWAVSPDT